MSLSRPAPSLLLVLAFLAGSAPARAQCSDALSVPRANAAATAVGELALVAGGRDLSSNAASSVVDLLDATSGAWTTASLSAERTYAAATSVDGRALVAGGATWSATFAWVLSDAVDVYDGSSGTWSTAALSQPRMNLVAASAGDVAVFAGGWRTGTPPLLATDRIDLYDAASDSWSTASLSQPRVTLAATGVGSKVLLAGGWNGASDSAVVDVYDAATDAWTTARLSQPRSDVAATAVGGRVYFAGGIASGGAPSDVVDVFDTRTDRWSTERLAVARYGAAATAAGDTALFAGGWSAQGPPSAQVDLFLVGTPRSFCHGDGSAAPCPCDNAGEAGHGCASSNGAGATLGGSGCKRVSRESLVLDVGELPPGQPALLFAGTVALAGGQGVAFGDGLRCVGGAVTRVGVQDASPAGSATWGPGLPAAEPGEDRYFQVWYRDPSGGPCGSGFNLTPAAHVRYAP